MPWHIAGGMETHAWRLAKAFQARGWNVTVLTSSFQGRDFVEERDGIPVHSIEHLPKNRERIPQWRWWRRFPRRALEYAKRAGLRADVYHSESLLGHAVLAWAKSDPAAARVMTLHGTALQNYTEDSRPAMLAQRGRWHPRAIAQWLVVGARVRAERTREMPSAAQIVTVSPALAAHVHGSYGVGRERLHPIANGVDVTIPGGSRAALRSKLGLPSDCRLVLYLGRLERSKGVERLVAHTRTHPRDVLVVAGTGSDEDRLRALTRDLTSPKRTRFLGRVDDPTKSLLLAASDVVCLPSDSEGQPIVLLEALAHGTPVYATRPWVPEGLADLVAHGPDVSAGIDAAERLRDVVRARAAAVRKAFSWDSVAAKYEAVFEAARRDTAKP